MAIEFVEHTGDTAVRIRASDAGELISEAARALLSVYLDVEGSEPVGEGEIARVDLQSADAESLLVDFLGELIYLFDSRRLLCARVDVREVRLDAPARLRGTIRGETFDELRHVFLTEVKAATYHGLEVLEEHGQLEVTVVFDL